MAEKRKYSTQIESPDLELASGFWSSVESLRGHIDTGDYKHLVLGLLFTRALSGSGSQKAGLHFREEESWFRILSATDAGGMIPAIEAAFRNISVVLNSSYPCECYKSPAESNTIREMVNLINGLRSSESGQNSLPEVFGYCLERFALSEGKTGGEFCTPAPIRDLLVKTLLPLEGSVYDPCCGTGGLLAKAWLRVQETHDVYPRLLLSGQESNLATWRLCKMNLALRGIPCDLGPHAADTFKSDHHAALKSDYVIANPPFNAEDWAVGSSQKNWMFGRPPASNANFAWIQHAIDRLAPHGIAAISMSNGALSSNTCGEGEIRRRIVDADLVDCIIALPANLFPRTRISASIWILARDKKECIAQGTRLRNRQRKTLFIDAQQMGRLVDRSHRVLDENELEKIAAVYHAWRGISPESGPYADESGFCRSCTTDEIAENDYLLTVSRYIGTAPARKEEPASVSIGNLVSKLDEQFKESTRLERIVRERLGRFGYDL